MDYRSNSHRSKDPVPEKKVEKIVVGTKTKKNEFKKIVEGFVSEDLGNIKSFIFMDILIPAVKKTITDIVNTILYPNGGNPSSRNSTASKISYRQYYDDPRETDRRPMSVYDYDDVELPSRGAAEAVLMRMDELIIKYGMVSVADFYDLVDVTGNYTDNKYGWTDIRSAKPVPVRGGGYIIKFPKAQPLN